MIADASYSLMHILSLKYVFSLRYVLTVSLLFRMVVSGGASKTGSFGRMMGGSRFTTDKQETLLHLLILTIAPILGKLICALLSYNHNELRETFKNPWVTQKSSVIIGSDFL